MSTFLNKPSGFSRSLLISGVLVMALSVVFAVYVRSEKKIDRANEQRLSSYLLADELRQSSDDMTRMVRSYIVTGNPYYKQRYQEILDIRNGKKPRPTSVQSAWHVMNSAPDPNFAGGKSIALKDLMKIAGFTDQEFAKLEEAHANSDDLTRIEFNAMRLIESAPAHDEATRLVARTLVFGEEYQEAKQGIMRRLMLFS